MEDLFYRIAVFGIPLPELKDRVEDIEVLAHHFYKWFLQKPAKNQSFLCVLFASTKTT